MRVVNAGARFLRVSARVWALSALDEWSKYQNELRQKHQQHRWFPCYAARGLTSIHEGHTRTSLASFHWWRH